MLPIELVEDLTNLYATIDKRAAETAEREIREIERQAGLNAFQATRDMRRDDPTNALCGVKLTNVAKERIHQCVQRNMRANLMQALFDLTRPNDTKDPLGLGSFPGWR